MNSDLLTFECECGQITVATTNNWGQLAASSYWAHLATPPRRIDRRYRRKLDRYQTYSQQILLIIQSWDSAAHYYASMVHDDRPIYVCAALSFAVSAVALVLFGW